MDERRSAACSPRLRFCFELNTANSCWMLLSPSTTARQRVQREGGGADGPRIIQTIAAY